MLKGLFAGLVLRSGQGLPGDLVNRALAWALGLPAESSLVPVVDVLLIAVERGLETEETLGHSFSDAAFGLNERSLASITKIALPPGSRCHPQWVDKLSTI